MKKIVSFDILNNKSKNRLCFALRNQDFHQSEDGNSKDYLADKKHKL
jgi:hypothetical protein